MKKLLFLILVLSVIALWPFFRQGYFETHDGEWMVIRFSAFHQTLASGQFPVRFVDRLNNNYGYPVLNFLYPLPFYLAEIPKVFGVGFVDSVKIVFILSTVASVLAMFWALSQIFNRWASFAGAILYLYAPYRFVDLYVRGSLGESVAFLFVPLIFGSILKITQGKKIFLPALALFTSMLIISHNVIAILFLPLFIIISLILIKKHRIRTISAFILGAFIATFFWLPALNDLRFVHLAQIDVSNVADHLVSPLKLIVPSWGYGPNPNDSNGLSVQIGIVSLAIFLSAFYLRKTLNSKNLSVDIFLILFILVFFLMTKFSLPLWNSLHFASVIQFPWRLLSLIVFITAFLAAYVINILNKKSTILTALIILASVISTLVYTKPLTFVNRGDGFYSTNEDSTTVRDEYLPIWVSEKPKERANQKILVDPSQAEITKAQIKPVFYKATISAMDTTKVQVNSIYFPGWQAKVDSRKVPIDYQNKYGLVTFNLPQGEHEVIINYGRSTIHLISEIISLAAIFTTVLFYFIWLKRNS